MLRELAVFHVKLVMDGLKDLALGPLSLAAAALGLLFPGTDPSRYLTRIKRLGRGYDAWVDLYDERDPDAASGGPATLDDHLRRLERAIADQRERGALPDQARDAIERALDTLDGLARSRPPRK